jgi:toxin ParE1/3/4
MKRFVLSEEARDDLQEIKSYIAEKSIEGARRVITEFRHAFRELGNTPGMGHRRQDLTKRPVLFWPVRSYLIIYRPGIQPLEIVAVLHGKRNLKRILRGRL